MSDNEDDINDEQGEEEQGGEEEGDIGAGEVEAGDEDTKVAEEGEGEGEEKEEKEDGEEKEGEEKEGGEEEEEEEKVPPKILTEEMLFECLSLLCKTGDGLAHAFIKLDVQERELTDISLLRSYIHLRFVDISTNHIKNLSPLSSLTHLLVLKADSNVLTSAQLDDLPYLQTANFSKNQIRNTIGIGHPMLENLNLNNNRIASITGLDAGKLHCLSVLELRANALESTRGLNIPTLKKLYLAANKITKLEDIGQLTQLVTLHMRENQLENLDGFTASMTNLEYINLRGNHVNDFAEIKKLQVLPNLKAIVLSENAIAERDDYRLETLITLRRLERLDKDQYNDDERHEAEDVYNQRVQEEMMNKQELADQQELLEEPPFEE